MTAFLVCVGSEWFERNVNCEQYQHAAMLLQDTDVLLGRPWHYWRGQVELRDTLPQCAASLRELPAAGSFLAAMLAVPQQRLIDSDDDHDAEDDSYDGYSPKDWHDLYSINSDDYDDYDDGFDERDADKDQAATDSDKSTEHKRQFVQAFVDDGQLYDVHCGNPSTTDDDTEDRCSGACKRRTID